MTQKSVVVKTFVYIYMFVYLCAKERLNILVNHPHFTE